MIVEKSESSGRYLLCRVLAQRASAFSSGPSIHADWVLG